MNGCYTGGDSPADQPRGLYHTRAKTHHMGRGGRLSSSGLALPTLAQTGKNKPSAKRHQRPHSTTQLVRLAPHKRERTLNPD